MSKLSRTRSKAEWLPLPYEESIRLHAELDAQQRPAPRVILNLRGEIAGFDTRPPEDIQRRRLPTIEARPLRMAWTDLD